MNQDFYQLITDELKIKTQQVTAVAKLLADDATVPFIARYRKERTGNMDEVQLRTFMDRHQYLVDLEARKTTGSTLLIP